MEKAIKKSKAKDVQVLDAGISSNENNNETVENRVEFEIQKFNIVDANILKLKEQFKDLQISGVDDKDGIKAVTEAMSIVRNLRMGVDKKRKELKDFYLNTGRGIDAEAKRILELIADVEEPLKAKKTAIDDEIQQIKDREAEAEQKLLDDKVDALKEAGIQFDGTFYSIGESISLDLVSIKDLNEENFARLLEMVKSEKEKIDNQVRLQELHEKRKEELLQYWSFVPEGFKALNMGMATEMEFNSILEEAKKGKAEFDKIQANQKAEADRQIQERKDLNFEKRSFRFEKEGFSVNEDGVSFVNESGNVLMSRSRIEELNNVEFDKEFELKIGIKKAFEKEVVALAEKRIKDAEAQAEAKIKANAEKLRKYVEDEIKKQQDFLEKLPEIDKVKRYCEEILNVSAPELKTPEAVEEFNLLFGEVKRSVEKTLSNLKNI